MHHFSLGRIHLLQLLNSSVQTVLHHITKIPIGLTNLLIGKLQNSLTILQTETITFHTLKCLGSTNKRFYIFWFYLEDSGTVTDCSVKIWDLLVTCSTIGVCFYCKGWFCLWLFAECVDAFCVELNGFLEISSCDGRRNDGNNLVRWYKITREKCAVVYYDYFVSFVGQWWPWSLTSCHMNLQEKV